MVWTQGTVRPIGQGEVDTWVYIPLTSGPGFIADAVSFEPDAPASDSWTRLGFYALGYQVAGSGLLGPINSIPRAPVESPGWYLPLDGSWAPASVANLSYPASPFVAVSIQRWVGPGTLTQWRLT